MRACLGVRPQLKNAMAFASRINAQLSDEDRRDWTISGGVTATAAS